MDAALRVLDAQGLAAVTMRRVATEVGTGAASLYAHVASKGDLHALMLDRIAADVAVPEPDPERWQEQTKDIIRALRDVMVARPGIAAVAVAQIPLGPEALRISDGLIAVLRAGGLTSKVIAYATDLLPLYATAIAQEAAERGENSVDAPDWAALSAEMGAFFTELPVDRFPNIVFLGPAMAAGDGEERFEFGLDILVAGLAAYRD